jgi:hypothetical protein
MPRTCFYPSKVLRFFMCNLLIQSILYDIALLLL